MAAAEALPVVVESPVFSTGAGGAMKREGNADQ